ncbi:unnamed protein product [Hermetia illucens]|uniref:Uncharacterized protein n=1 Tax=Hermetia illucens TaxID=343691 RepID=A0A7R8V3M9_HERIL|nr:unnamed protein product [Hermetia illucens]
MVDELVTKMSKLLASGPETGVPTINLRLTDLPQASTSTASFQRNQLSYDDIYKIAIRMPEFDSDNERCDIYSWTAQANRILIKIHNLVRKGSTVPSDP